MYSKESLIPGHLWEATLIWRKRFPFRKGVILEIVLLGRKVDMMGKTFSSSFVRDCSYLLIPEGIAPTLSPPEAHLECSIGNDDVALFPANRVPPRAPKELHFGIILGLGALTSVSICCTSGLIHELHNLFSTALKQQS